MSWTASLAWRLWQFNSGTLKGPKSSTRATLLPAEMYVKRRISTLNAAIPGPHSNPGSNINETLFLVGPEHARNFLMFPSVLDRGASIRGLVDSNVARELILGSATSSIRSRELSLRARSWPAGAVLNPSMGPKSAGVG